MTIWSSPFIFFHRKRIKTPALSQHIHCYCCSALRNAYNKISLFRVSDSCLQWSDFIHFQYVFSWKYLVWDWLGVAIVCSWKLISFFMVVLCTFSTCSGSVILGKERVPSCLKPCAVHLLLWEPLNAAEVSPWCSASPVFSCVCGTKGAGTGQSRHCSWRVTGSSDLLGTAAQPLLTQVLRFGSSGHSEVTRYS